MSNPICTAFWRRRLLATALPFGLLAVGAMSAQAGSVTVTGANGANGAPGGAGGSATATTTTPSDPSNTATATGGNGGSVCFSGSCVRPGARGGAGGAANSTATTSISSGAASAEATSFGGRGGGGSSFGYHGELPGPGGNGGAASSSAAASSATGSASATASSTGGWGGSTPGSLEGGAGAGTAAASATSGTTGSASATASSTGGAGRSASGGAATASANAQNSDGAALTAASAPAGVSRSALTTATVTSASSSFPTLVNITAGEAVSNATLTPDNGSIVGVGAMSAAYSQAGASQAVTYEATATFDFSTSKSEALDLYLGSDNSANSAGNAFDNLELQVVNLTAQKDLASFTFTGLSGAEKFFSQDPVSLGTFGVGSQSIEVEYSLGYNSGTSAVPGDGFGFTYALVDPRSRLAAPELSTWAMMALGFAGLAFAGYRRSRKAAVLAV
jgi:hypothetical protein